MSNNVSIVNETDVVVEEDLHVGRKVGHYTGQCKWFNDTYGYGFLTVCDGEDKGKDVFVHHTGICPLNSNYRTLKKGEYLSFDIEKGVKGLQAVNVKGIHGGPLMCDCIATYTPRTYASHTFTPLPPLSYQTHGDEPTSNTPDTPNTPEAPRPLRGKLANIPPHMYAQGQWLVMTKTGRVKNLAKYSKEGREAMKIAKQNGFVPPYRKYYKPTNTEHNT
jgi:CspA family cold shock protein